MRVPCLQTGAALTPDCQKLLQGLKPEVFILSQTAPPFQHQLPSFTLGTHTNLWFLPNPARARSLLPHTPREVSWCLGETHPLLTGREWGLSPNVSLEFLKRFSSVKERKANLWVAEHCLEKFCSLLLSLSPRFFPANDGHMHIYETIICLHFLSASLLLCSELPWQSYPKSVLREDESSLLSVPTNMKIGGISDFSDIFLVF